VLVYPISERGISMKTGQHVVHVLGVFNLLFAGIGMWVTLQTLAHPGHLLNTQVSPFLLQAFYTMSVLNLLFVLAVGVSGIFLLLVGVKVIRVVNVVFIAEVSYFALSLCPFPGQLGHSITEAYGIGNVAIMAQMVVGYPLIALVVLNLVRPRLQKSAVNPN
jgi:hypothetical protein